MSSALSFWPTREGVIEEVSEVEMNVAPGNDCQKATVFQVLRTTCAMPQPVTSLIRLEIWISMSSYFFLYELGQAVWILWPSLSSSGKRVCMVELLWRMGIKFVKHFIWNTYSVHSNFTVHIYVDVFELLLDVLAKHYVNNYRESLLQGTNTPYQVGWKAISVHTWVSRRDIVKPFFDNCPRVITWYRAITLESHYKTAHGIGWKEGLGPQPKSY